MSRALTAPLEFRFSSTGLGIAKELVSRKLAGQAQIVGYKLRDSATAAEIEELRSAITIAETISALRRIGPRHVGVASGLLWREPQECAQRSCRPLVRRKQYQP